MPNDVIVVVDIDAKPKGVETLDILLLSTEGQKEMKTYRDLAVVNTDYPGKKVAKMAKGRNAAPSALSRSKLELSPRKP